MKKTDKNFMDGYLITGIFFAVWIYVGWKMIAAKIAKRDERIDADRLREVSQQFFKPTYKSEDWRRRRK